MRYRAQDIIITVGTAIAHITNGNLDLSVAPVETTGGGDTGRNRDAGYEDWSLTGTSRFNGDQLTPGTIGTCSMAINPPSGGNVEIFSGTGLIQRFAVGGDHEQAVDVNFEIVRARD